MLNHKNDEALDVDDSQDGRAVHNEVDILIFDLHLLYLSHRCVSERKRPGNGHYDIDRGMQWMNR